MRIEFLPKGVCSRKMIIETDDEVIKNLEIIGGCSGNSQGICSLVQGMNIDDVITKLSGITCGAKSTSCPAQLAEALKQIKNS